MSLRNGCVWFVVVSLLTVAVSGDQANKPKTESVMSPGMKLVGTTSAGKIEVIAVDELTRCYTWEGASRSISMAPRAERWYGSLGLFFPGPGDHWKEHNGITRGVTEEGQQHFKSTDEAMEWMRSRMWMPYVYRDDGLVVAWSKTLPRKQLNVEVWQILVNGKKPERLPGSHNESIAITQVEIWTSPLGKAIQKGDPRTIKEHLASGGDPNSTNIVGRPVLVEAAKRGYDEIVAALIKNGAKVNERDEDGSTALMNAIEAGHVQTVKQLVIGGANVNVAVESGLAKGMTPLMQAAMEHPEIVKILLANGANVNAKTELSGLTAIFFAREGNQQETVRLLQQAGAKD